MAHYLTSTVEDPVIGAPAELSVIAVLEPKVSPGIQEFFVAADYDILIERHLIREQPVQLTFIQWENLQMTYPAHRIHYIRRVAARIDTPR